MDQYTKMHDFCQEMFEGDVSFRMIAEHPKVKKSGIKPIKLLSCEGSLDERIEKAVELNKKGFGFFYVPQKFRVGYEENYSQIEAFRMLVVDLDGAPLDAVRSSHLVPSLVVETSPKKYQVLFKLSPVLPIDKMSVEEFNVVFSSLTEHYGGDLSAAKATQVFRMPWSWHWKSGERIRCKILE